MGDREVRVLLSLWGPPGRAAHPAENFISLAGGFHD
jgi:hypothetical protein